MANILIADGQPCVRELLSEEMAHEGHRVWCVGDAKSILEHLRDSRPDLVLLDLYIDGRVRWDVLHVIKNNNPDLPVLIFTAYDSFAEDARLSQADGYIVKSFVAIDKLKEKVAEILKWKVAGHKAHESKTVEKTNLLHLRPIHRYPISTA